MKYSDFALKKISLALIPLGQKFLGHQFEDVKEAIKDDPELYDWILNYDELQDLKIRGTRDGIKGKSPAVDIMLSIDKQFVILTMDCAFYLLEKE